MLSNKTFKAFTLIEIMIVVAVIGIIIAIALPAFLRSREIARSRSCQENLSKIDWAVDMYALDNKLQTGDSVTLGGLVSTEGTGYLKSVPKCPGGGSYGTALTVNTPPVCSIGTNAGAVFAPHAI